MACPQCGDNRTEIVTSPGKEMRTRQVWKENRPSEGPGGYYINVHDGYNVTKMKVCSNCSTILDSWIEHEK